MEVQSIPPVTAERKALDWKVQCAALIPCFNEARAVPDVVHQARLYLPTIVVVDDGSTDNTAEIARNAGAEVVRVAANRGKGAALRIGFQHLRDLGFSYALTMDGDGQHAATDITKFFDRAEQTNAALVIGNRMEQANRMPWLRRRVNRWMTRKLSQLTYKPLADSQCGFRLVKLDVLLRLKLTTEHFEIESELLTAFSLANERIEFVPIEVIYNSGRSKIRVVMDTVRWLRWWWRQ